MNIEQKTGQYKNQKLNKNVTVCSITLTPGLWLIIGYIDGNISSDFIYNNTLYLGRHNRKQEKEIALQTPVR